MKICFIRPSMFGLQSKDAMKPLVFAIIKPLTPKSVDICFYDERVEKIPDKVDADVVAMTVETFSAKRAFQLASKYREEGKKVIMGGFHPTMVPDECIEHCDSVIIGEAEDTWGMVIKDLQKNKLKKIYQSNNNCKMTNIKYDYSVFEGKKYHKIGLAQFSRGCKFNCEFCSIHAFYKNCIRTKDIDSIINEIKNIKEKLIFFIDDNIFSDEEKAAILFDKLVPLKKKWVCQISIDIAKNKDLLKKMKKSGCIMVLIGFESLNENNLKQMGKGANLKYKDYEKVIKNVYDAGIMIYGTFVIGYDYDTKDTYKELVDFAIKNKFAIANFNPLMPMPGTRLYDRLKKENRLLHDKWWLDDDYRYGDAMLIPKKMTPEELLYSCKTARYTFNTYKNIFKRSLNFKSNCRGFMNLGIYYLVNLVSRFEIHMKQGRRLGYDENNTN